MCHLALWCPGNRLQASEGIAESMKTLAASKQKYSNCRTGTTRPRIKRQYAPQLVHHSEIIVALLYRLQNRFMIKLHKQKTHILYMLSKGPLDGLQNRNKKIFKRVHGNRAAETDLQLSSCFPRKSNPSENCLNCFEVLYSHQEGVQGERKNAGHFFLHNTYNKIFVTDLIEGHRKRHRQLGWTLRSA